MADQQFTCLVKGCNNHMADHSMTPVNVTEVLCHPCIQKLREHGIGEPNETNETG